MVALLSQNSFTDIFTFTFISLNNLTSHTISEIAEAILLYSASVVFLDMISWLFDFQEIKDLSNLTLYPISDFLIIVQDAQSESQKALNAVSSSLKFPN